MVKTYDPACHDLAEHFLRSEPCSDDPDLYKHYCHDLALTIQQAIEDWFIFPSTEQREGSK